MKRFVIDVMVVLLIGVACQTAWATYPGSTVTGVDGQITGTFGQETSVIGGGNANSNSTSDSDSSAVATGGTSSSTSSGGSGLGYSTSTLNYSPTSISNYKTRTPPIGAMSPYLPMWNHGGWGTIKGYFSNGPTADDAVYERTFDPADTEDVQELRGIMEAVPYNGPLEMIGGVLNGFGAAFGGPDNFHHGRGFEIASSLVRDRRPEGKPLLVFVDSNVDRGLLKRAGYTYVGKVSIDAKETRNWDQAYDAAVVEALPWDVDILLVSGGMKGVTVGSNLSFPSASMGYSQVNYSLSLLGGTAKGVTEAKGKPVMDGEAYRYCPRLANKRRVPSLFYERMKARYGMAEGQPGISVSGLQAQPSAPVNTTPGVKGIEMSPELYQMAGFQAGQQVDMVTVR